MELKCKTTIQDVIDATIIVRRLSRIEEKNINQRRIIYLIFLLISICLLFMATKAKVYTTLIMSAILIVISFINIIFAKKINNCLYKKKCFKKL